MHHYCVLTLYLPNPISNDYDEAPNLNLNPNSNHKPYSNPNPNPNPNPNSNPNINLTLLEGNFAVFSVDTIAAESAATFWKVPT